MSKSKAFCSVPLCNSLKMRNPEYTFHFFPKEGKEKVYFQVNSGKRELIDRQKAWAIKLRIGKPITSYMTVCSRHFREDDFFHAKGLCVKRYLKRTAVPSRCLPSSTCHSTPDILSKCAENRQKMREEKIEITSSVDSFPCDSSETVRIKQEEREVAEGPNKGISLLNMETQPNNRKHFRDFEVQVNTLGSENICSLRVNYRALNCVTGLGSFKLLERLERALNSFCKDERVHKLSIGERVILTFFKLKCSLSYNVMAILFGINIQMCSDYISKMLHILPAPLECTVHMDSLVEIERNLQKCFEDFPKTCIIFDCRETAIHKPKSLCCRILFFSQNKGYKTIKLMTGVSPAGLAMFVSEVYGGRASDRKIFEQSHVITKMNRGEAIMVHKGFLVDDLCALFGVTLLCSPFLKQKKQLTAEQGALNARIARARVHVERVSTNAFR